VVSAEVFFAEVAAADPGAGPVAGVDQDHESMVPAAPEAVAKLDLVAKPKPAAAPGAGGDESIRVSLRRLEKLLNFVGEMVILQTVLREQAQLNGSLLLRRTVHQLGKVTKEVQDISMSLRMVPLKQNFQKMQRIVRDTAGMLNKKINLVLEGEETELDKTVLENLGDPLVHLVRNSVDHGVEAPAERLAAGKPEVGTVILRAYHQGGRLVIDVIDDGAGIDAERLRLKAIEKKIIQPETPMSEKELINLIFHSGFSTKTQVTEVSGRGVGMDVVKTNIEALQGDVQVSTELGKGTRFTITLPLTMAIIDGMVVRIKDDRYVIPLSHVHESMRPGAADIQTSTNLGEILLLRGENLPLFRLTTLLGKKAPLTSAVEGIAIVIRTDANPFAILVDDILGQQQVVVKKLGSEINDLKGFSGSAILGDGRPSLILELGDLVAKGAPSRNIDKNTKPRRNAA